MSTSSNNFKDIAVPEGESYDAMIQRVQTSHLYNEDLRPIRADERNWRGREVLFLWISISVVITTYTIASSLIESGMSWGEALFTVTLANVVVLVPMILNAYVGTRYGIPFPVFVRSSFGTQGAKVAAMARGLVGCGWFGIQTWLGALALSVLLARIWPAWGDVPGNKFIAFAVFWGIQIAILSGGINAIRLFQRGAAPLLTVSLIAIFGWAIWAGGGFTAPLVATEHLSASSNHSFWELFWPGLAANIGYWATLSLNIPDFTRFATSQREQVVNQAIGLPLGMMVTSFVGIFVTGAAFYVYGEVLWNPIELLPHITNNAIILIIATVAIMIAQVSINMAANVVSPANDISNLVPKYVSFRGGVIITGIIGVIMQPWYLIGSASAYIFTWLSGYGSLLGAIGAVMVIDYWLIRRKTFGIEDLYVENKRYRNWNVNAFIAVIVSVAPMLPGFVVAATTPGGLPEHVTLLTQIYSFGWFWSFPVAAIIYYLLERIRPSELNSYAAADSVAEASAR